MNSVWQRLLQISCIVLTWGTAPVSAALPNCPQFLYEPGVKEFKYLGDFSIPTGFKVKNPIGAGEVTAKAAVANLVKKFSGKDFTRGTFLDAVDQVYKAVKELDIDDVAKGQKMGQFGQALDPVFEGYLAKFPVVGDIDHAKLGKWMKRKEALDHVKRTKFAIMMSTADLENFKLSEYEVVSKDDFFMTQGSRQKKATHMPLVDYPKYVESQLSGIFGVSRTKAKLYKEIDEASGGGILSIPDIRNITSYNLWPMYAKEHDMRHVRYGLSHPLALASMMRATRSKNHLRYVVMGGLYEGVDRLQYSQETAINQFFATEIAGSQIFKHIRRNLDLEEAMLMVGYMPESTLNKLVDEVDGGWSSFRSFAESVEDWRPKIVEGTNLRGMAMVDGGRKVRSGYYDLEADVSDMVANFSDLVRQADELRVELLQNPNKVLSKREKMLSWMMNYQLDPDSPEIVIEGLAFKNDGRAHFDDYTDRDSPLGIGDQ